MESDGMSGPENTAWWGRLCAALETTVPVARVTLDGLRSDWRRIPPPRERFGVGVSGDQLKVSFVQARKAFSYLQLVNVDREEVKRAWRLFEVNAPVLVGSHPNLIAGVCFTGAIDRRSLDRVRKYVGHVIQTERIVRELSTVRDFVTGGPELWQQLNELFIGFDIKEFGKTELHCRQLRDLLCCSGGVIGSVPQDFPYIKEYYTKIKEVALVMVFGER